MDLEALLARMTLAEKIGQMTMTAAPYAVTGPVAGGDIAGGIRSGAIGNLLNLYGPDAVRDAQRMAVEETRLGIPLLIGLDVIHGHRTLFPLPLAETGIFDPQVWALTAREAACEAAADGVHMTFAPMLDVARDPRWGRIAEGPGEDPYVAGMVARAKVAGFQGADLSDAGAVAAVAKHFCAYGAVTAGREYASTDVSDRALAEIYLPPFVAAVQAGVAAIMPAFTDLAGVPLTAHRKLLKDYLRGTLGFDGVVVSDYNAIAELMRHGVAGDLIEAAALALDAGVDIDMMAGAYAQGLPAALAQGRVVLADIDAAVRRVLRLKQQLGLFDDPYRRGRGEDAAAVAARRAVSRDVAARAVVLLKNDGDVLPLAAPRRIALVGPLADAPGEMRGVWWAAAQPEGQVSVLAGLRAALPDSEIRFLSGTAIQGDDESGIAAAAALCDGADVVILCVGEAADMSGEASSRAHPHLPGRQQALADAVRARAGGKPLITILFSGRPLVVPELIAQSDAVLAAWFLGSEAGNALADLLTGSRAPSGRTPVSWPRAVGQIPVFFGQRSGGRPENPADHFTSKYLDAPNTPQFVFGHGLSYGRVAYDALSVSPLRAGPGDTLLITADIHNPGPRAVEETVFLFIHDKLASVTRPLLELKGFCKLVIEPGVSGRAEFSLPAADLRFPGRDLTPVLEPGEIEILVGPSADRARMLGATIVLCETP